MRPPTVAIHALKPHSHEQPAVSQAVPLVTTIAGRTETTDVGAGELGISINGTNANPNTSQAPGGGRVLPEASWAARRRQTLGEFKDTEEDECVRLASPRAQSQEGRHKRCAVARGLKPDFKSTPPARHLPAFCVLEVVHATARRALRPNPSLNRSSNGRPPSPVRWYTVHLHRPGLGVLPLPPG